MSQCVPSLVYPAWDSLYFLYLVDYFFSMFGTFSAINLLLIIINIYYKYFYHIINIFSGPFSFLSLSGTPTMWMLVCLSQRSLRLSSFLLILFSYSLLQQWFPGKQTPVLQGTNKTFCAPRLRRKEWPHRRLNQNYLLVLDGFLWGRHGLAGAHHRNGAAAWKVRLGGRHQPEGWVTSGQKIPGREHNLTHQQIVGLKLYWARPCPLEEGPVFLTTRRRWHPTPVLLPGKSRGWRSLVGYSPWGR